MKSKGSEQLEYVPESWKVYIPLLVSVGLQAMKLFDENWSPAMEALLW